MSHKSARILAMIAAYEGRDLPAHYLGYLACFNEALYYESHDVLEDLWLSVRGGPEDGFYKGLIQFAGAFVHLQKNRLRPAASLFKLSRTYLAPYGPVHHRLDVHTLTRIIDDYLDRLERGHYNVNPLHEAGGPVLALISQDN